MTIGTPKSLIDELSPREYGEDRIVLRLSESTSEPRALSPVIVEVDFSACDPEGVVLPLELVVTGPSGKVTERRQVFRRRVPTELTFTPIEGGSTLVRLAEMFHNRWWGKLVIEVEGDPLDRDAG
jgi:hypothetical protein